MLLCRIPVLLLLLLLLHVPHLKEVHECGCELMVGVTDGGKLQTYLLDRRTLESFEIRLEARIHLDHHGFLALCGGALALRDVLHDRGPLVPKTHKPPRIEVASEKRVSSILECGLEQVRDPNPKI